MREGIWLDVVESTLDEIHDRAAAGAEDGTWLVAAEQRAGRGSRGRRWESGRGGLWLSLLRRGGASSAGFELLSLRAGLAVAQVLDGLPPVAPVQLKWPNDVMVHGKKAGGILAEARWQGERLHWVAMGVGLNVENGIPAELAGRATALREFCTEASVESLAPSLAAALAALDLERPVLDAGEVAEYRRRDWLFGRSVSAPLAGTAAGVGADGRLAVRDAQGRLRHVGLGEVLAA